MQITENDLPSILCKSMHSSSAEKSQRNEIPWETKFKMCVGIPGLKFSNINRERDHAGYLTCMAFASSLHPAIIPRDVFKVTFLRDRAES